MDSLRWRLAALSGPVLAVLLSVGTPANAFPKKVNGPVRGAPAVLELTGPGVPAVVVGAGSRVVVLAAKGGGQLFAFELGEKEEIAGDIAAADWDRDGRSEVAVATRSGKLFVIGPNGAALPGFPQTLEVGAQAGPSFGDLDGDGRLELLIGDRAGGLHAFRKGGQEAPGFPAQLGSPVSSTVAVGRLRGATALAVGTESGRVRVLDALGKPLPKFNLATNAIVSATPAFGDLDDDGSFDLVVASQDFKLYAVNADGKPLDGFPVPTGLPCYGSPALADVNGDDALEVAFTSADGSLYLLDGKGKPFPGFPVELSPRILTGVAVADLDRDGELDLVTAGSDAKVHAVSLKGKKLPGFPQLLDGEMTGTPFVAVIGGTPTVFAGAPDGTLGAYTTKAKGNAPPKVPWASSGRDPSRAGFHFPNPPRFKALVLNPEEPRIDSALKAQWEYASTDGIPESTKGVSWLRNGKPVAELAGKRELPPRTAKKGEKWRYTIQVGERTLQSPEVTVQNTPPSNPEARLTPASPTRLTGLKAEVSKPATDADGDALKYEVAWLVDGAPTSLKGETLAPEKVRKGQRWTAVVTPLDGASRGTAAYADAVIGNTPPSAPAVSLKPASVKKGQDLLATVDKPAADVDGDKLAYHYRWSVNGEPKNYPLEQAQLPTASLKTGDKVTVSVTAFDGDVEGPAATGAAQLINTAPGAPQVALRPNPPRQGQPLRAAVVTPSADPDLDPITYKPTWTRNGKPFTAPGAGFEVPAAEVKKGDKWEVRLLPNDGQVDGAAATAAATVQNSAPTAPLLVLKPERPKAGAPIEVEVVRESTDADGDKVRYRFTWTRNGQPVSGPPDARKLSPGQFAKHEKVRVTATPNDGQVDGAVGAAEVEVDNTPPTALEVTLQPATPTLLAPLKAVVSKAATDVDKDALTYRYAWKRNGEALSLPESQAEIPAKDLRKDDRWSVSVRAWDGEDAGPSAWAVAQVGNVPPSPPTVALEPKRPRRGDGLRAVAQGSTDADGDVVTYRYVWSRDGKALPLPPDAAAVARSGNDAPKKGQKWAVEVFAQDGAAESKPTRVELTIANTPPTAPAVGFCAQGQSAPAEPGDPTPGKPPECAERLYAGMPLEVKVHTPSTDVDGDKVSYLYAWSVNGAPRELWKNRPALGPKDLKKGERVQVTVTPTDGTDTGPSASADWTVENTAPSAAVVQLEPAEPTAESGLKVKVTRPGEDRDQDPVSYRYRWWKEGLAFKPEGDGSGVPPGALKRGDALRVVVTSFDGSREGFHTVAEARVKNTPPPRPKVVVEPQKPKALERLTCKADLPSVDADGDAVRLHYAWFRNNIPSLVAQDQPELPTGTVRKGEKWRCEAWADDGHALSARVSAEVTVENSPPGAPQIAVEPAQPVTGDALTCRVTSDAPDIDGDPARYRYSWTRNGQPFSDKNADPTRVDGKQVKRGDKWACQVVASDGALEGAPASLERKVGNAPPSAPEVTLAPRAPQQGDELSCDVVQPSVDPEGKKVVYRFVWLKDGTPQGFASTSVKVPGRLLKKGDRWTCQVQPSDGELDGPLARSGETRVQ